MKDVARQKMSIKVDCMDLLNEQIEKESHAASSYLAMASWCDQHGYSNSAHFFYHQVNEEREHMMRIFKFINDCGGNALSPETGRVNHDYASLEEVFETALDQEIEITKSIHGMVISARKQGDLNTENFLQWFVTEQMEEEQTMRDILGLFDNMSGMAPILIDDRIKKE
ncbi:MAG: ferritin [Cellulophaga sp.]